MLWLPKKPAIIRAPADALDRFGNPRVRGGLFTGSMMMGGSVTPATITFTETGVSATDGTSFTFSGKSIGTAAANRKVAVAICGRKDTTGAYSVSTVTVGGISASQIVDNFAEVGGIILGVALWQADVPTGTTADVVVTFSANTLDCGIGLFAVYGAAAAADATATSTANPCTTTINVPANGVSMGVATTYTTNPTYTWDAGLTERWDTGIDPPGSGITFTGASDAFAALQTGMTVTVTPSSASGNRMALASFGPA